VSARILEAYRELGGSEVAVRSSGTAEDLASASFAGQHDTFLNVSGPDALLDAVRACWASLWSPRAVAYRRQRDWEDTALALALVVQEMVPAEWSGVLLTADPVTGRRDQMIDDC
jgi:pyruvate,water dikinase